MRATVLLALLIASAPGAASAGGFTCTASQKKVEIEIDASTDAARGGAVYEVTGQVKVRAGSKQRMTAIDVDSTHLAQYWSDEEELRVKLVRLAESDAQSAPEETGGDVAAEPAEEEAEPTGSVDLSFVAHRDSATGEFEGSYRLASSLLAGDATGAVVCVVEPE